MTTETVLLSGHKHNKTSCCAGDCKGRAVHSPGKDRGSGTLVLNSDHWRKAFARVVLLMQWARVHSGGEEGLFHWVNLRLKMKLTFLSHGKTPACQYK